jgi:hypothetical protein
VDRHRLHVRPLPALTLCDTTPRLLPAVASQLVACQVVLTSFHFVSVGAGTSTACSASTPTTSPRPR